MLDGNPLGVQGGRILIKVATELGIRLTMSAKNCDFNIHNSNFVFNINGKPDICLPGKLSDQTIFSALLRYRALRRLYAGFIDPL